MGMLYVYMQPHVNIRCVNNLEYYSLRYLCYSKFCAVRDRHVYSRLIFTEICAYDSSTGVGNDARGRIHDYCLNKLQTPLSVLVRKGREIQVIFDVLYRVII
jgi:hypothetical protein